MVQLNDSTALLLIDWQWGFDDLVWGQRNHPDAEQQVAQLLQAWRQTNRSVLHVQHLSSLPHSPLRPGQSGCEFKPEVSRYLANRLFKKL